MQRTPNCLAKLDRMTKTLHHEEADRVPIAGFFWGSFLERWRSEKGPAGRHGHLQVLRPGLDRHGPEHGPAHQAVRGAEGGRRGRGRPHRLRGDHPQEVRRPHARMARLRHRHDRKGRGLRVRGPLGRPPLLQRGDNQIAAVGDGFARNSPAWIETIKDLHPNFPVYGSVCEANEYMQRIIGPESLFMWVGLYPEQMGHFIERANAFALEILKAQIKAADGLLDGIVIWGDIVYKKDLFFSPKFWRKWYKPRVQDAGR